MDYIKLNGEDHPFWYSILANRENGKTQKEDKDNIYFIWLGLKYGARREKKEFKFTEDDIAEMLDINLDEYNVAMNLLDEQLGKLTAAGGRAKE